MATQSTPVAAIAGSVVERTPPEASSGTRPATCCTAALRSLGGHVVEQDQVRLRVDRRPSS